MLNRPVMLLQIFLVLFIISAAFGQDVEVLKAELKGMEGRLDAKIDGVKDTLDAKIDGAKDTLDQKITGTKDELTTGITGTKNELTASMNGVKSEVVTIKWIIGITAGVFVAFLGFVGYLLNHYVKKILPTWTSERAGARRKSKGINHSRNLLGGKVTQMTHNLITSQQEVNPNARHSQSIGRRGIC